MMLSQPSLLERLLRFGDVFLATDHSSVSFRPFLDHFFTCPKSPTVLKMLATLPSYQRQGVAAIQLAWATHLADEKGLVCWVEGSVVAVPLYRKFGFEVQDEIVSQCHGIDGIAPYISTCMMRVPKKGQM
tara:strand:+ start:108 stop:497 length:390 start_codon:yes stop_codon:yes gene_type:complete